MRISSSVQGPMGGAIPTAVDCFPCKPLDMFFARLFRKFSQPTSTPSDTTDPETSTSGDSNIPRRGRQNSELMATSHHPWKAEGPSSTDHPSSPQSTPTPPLTSKDKGPTTESGVDDMSLPVPAVPSVLLTNVAAIPSPEMVPATGTLSDKLADAWDTIKDDTKFANTSQSQCPYQEH